jgi:hypothetical protein
LGFEEGGFITSLIINITAFIIFIFFLKNNLGEIQAKIGMWLLATYPGITYWVGLPYCYVMIVPGTLLLTILLWKINGSSSHLAVSGLSFLMGFICLGYDLVAFFLPSTVLSLFFNKKYKLIPVATVAFIMPIALSTYMLTVIFGAPFETLHTNIYSAIGSSYFKVTAEKMNEWGNLLLMAPLIGIDYFFFSNFFFIPFLFLIIIVFLRIKGISLKLSVIEKSILISAILIFLFNNLAPPYDFEYHYRGYVFARLYQPVFIVFLLYILRSYTAFKLKPGLVKYYMAGIVFTVLFNASIVFGPVSRNPLASYVYFLFYKHHGDYNMMVKNIDKYGRRPMGICE